MFDTTANAANTATQMRVRSTLGTVEHDYPLGELNAITSRINAVASGIEDVGSKLRDHACAVFGALPENELGDEAVPFRAGLLGALHDALDRLEQAQQFVGEQAARNCTLA